MIERPDRLSARFVETIREPGTYGDGRGSGGLSLRVKRTARGHLAKSWGQRREVCELALAQINANAIKVAYRPTDLFERRRTLIEQWNAFRVE